MTDTAMHGTGVYQPPAPPAPQFEVTVIYTGDGRIDSNRYVCYSAPILVGDDRMVGDMRVIKYPFWKVDAVDDLILYINPNEVRRFEIRTIVDG
jgi:hypothetical protein